MNENLDEVHAKIAEIKSRDPEGITKTSLKDIPEIKDKDWETLKARLFDGTIQVHEMTTSPISFELLAAPSDRAGFKLLNTLAILAPLAAVLLAFMFSWWFLLLALGSFVMLRTAKGFYRTVIFQGVTASEAVFCFLFSRNTICLQQDGAPIFRKNE
jgi:hypothetical protein